MDMDIKETIAGAISDRSLGLSSLDDVAMTAATMTTTQTCVLCILRFFHIPAGPVYLTRSLDTIRQDLGIKLEHLDSNGS
ncbi:hypothetical protein GGI13_006596, partial [Coemansia sp. RSA 455]